MNLRTIQGIVAAGLIGGSLLIGCSQDSIDAEDTIIESTFAPLLGDDNPDAIDGQYIVVFKDSVGAKSIDAAKKSVATFKSSAVERSFSIIPGFSAKLSNAAVDQLRRNPDVAYVERDAVVTLGAVDTTDVPNGLDRIDATEGYDGSYDDRGNNGAGVHIYIVDTGINAGHNEFAGRVGNGRDEVDNDSNPDDCHGHGTHVASTTAGTEYGVAEAATIHAVRVLNCQGSGTNSGVIAGVDWVAANAIQPAVANMSLGGGANSSLDTAVNNAVAAGITFAVAAGNDSADACGYSPARAADAITVAATSASSDARASFSNYGSCVDIHAPGSSIKGAWIGSSTATNTISGTSMASPHVAGLAASYLGANPGSSPAQVQAGLEAVANLNCVTSANGSPNLLIYNDFNATSQHDCGNGGGGGGGGNAASCIENNACGGFAPSGCACDAWCIFFGDCCADGPC